MYKLKKYARKPILLTDNYLIHSDYVTLKMFRLLSMETVGNYTISINTRLKF